MFEGIAKRKLEKEVAQMLVKGGATWCLSYKQVKDDLLKKHPSQQDNIESLCQFLAADGWKFFASHPDPLSYKLRIDYVAKAVMQKGSLDLEKAKWATACWVKALVLLSPEQRAEFPKHRAFLISCWQVAFPNETAAIQTEATKVQEIAVLAIQAKSRARIARYIAEDPRWGMPNDNEDDERPLFREDLERRLGGFTPAQTKKDYEKERLKREQKELQREAELKKLIAKQESDREGRLEEDKKIQQSFVEAMIQRDVDSSRDTRDIRPSVDAEIWRRIQVAPNQAALRSKLEEVAKAKREQARVVAERQRAEQQQQLQAEANERKRLDTEKSNKAKEFRFAAADAPDEVEERKKLMAQAAEHQRIYSEKRRTLQAEENKRLASARQAEIERRKQQQAIEIKRSKIQKYRQNFPLQCAGVSDEEIWEQIKGS